MTRSARLVQSYDAPAGDPVGDQIRGRAWTYDSAVTATARAAAGDLDGAGALLDAFQDIQRSDGALEGSYDLAGHYGAGPLRSGNQAWVGLAALAVARADVLGPPRPPDRGDRALAARPSRLRSRLARLRAGPWRAGRLVGLDGAQPRGPRASSPGSTPRSPGGRWIRCSAGRASRASTGSPATLRGRWPLSVREAVERIDRAIDAALFVRSGGAAYLRQGLGDDARPLDVQALGILWLLGRGRHADAQAVSRTADATMWVDGRRVDWPGADGQTFGGYRPFVTRGARTCCGWRGR